MKISGRRASVAGGRGGTHVKDLRWEHDSVFKERWKGQGGRLKGVRSELAGDQRNRAI